MSTLQRRIGELEKRAPSNQEKVDFMCICPYGVEPEELTEAVKERLIAEDKLRHLDTGPWVRFIMPFADEQGHWHLIGSQGGEEP